METSASNCFLSQTLFRISKRVDAWFKANRTKTTSDIIDMKNTKVANDKCSPFYKPGLWWLPSSVQRLTMCGAGNGFLPRLERKNRHTIQQQRGEAKLDWTSSPTEAPTTTSWEILAERRDYTTPTNPRGQCRDTPRFPVLEKSLSKDAAFWYCGSIFVPRRASHIQACLLKLLWNPSQISVRGALVPKFACCQGPQWPWASQMLGERRNQLLSLLNRIYLCSSSRFFHFPSNSNVFNYLHDIWTIQYRVEGWQLSGSKLWISTGEANKIMVQSWNSHPHCCILIMKGKIWI